MKKLLIPANRVEMNFIKNKLFTAVIWYTFITTLFAVCIDLYNISQSLFRGSIRDTLIIFFTSLFEFICMMATMSLLRKRHKTYIVKYIMYYWIAQIFFFGMKGISYCFITGFNVAVYFKYFNTGMFGYFIRYWSQELSIYFFGASERFYIGVNIMPLSISILLIYLLHIHTGT